MMPQKYYIPWEQVDPALKHGGIPDELAGMFVAPDLGDNPTSSNRTLVSVFYEWSQAVASVSMHPLATVEGHPDKAIVDEALRATQTFMERVITSTHSHASKFFYNTHAIPPVEHFRFNAIRSPEILRNQFAADFVFYGIGALVELAENNRNGVHKGIDPDAAEVLLAGMYDWKGEQMKYWFGKEIAGEISDREMAELYDKVTVPNPFYPDRTSDQPPPEETKEALTGIDVMTWIPTENDWTTFSHLRRRRYKAERVHQPEGVLHTTEDVRTESLHNAPGTNTGGPTV